MCQSQSGRNGVFRPCESTPSRGRLSSLASPAQAGGLTWSLTCPETSGSPSRSNRNPVREHLWGAASCSQVCEPPRKGTQLPQDRQVPGAGSWCEGSFCQPSSLCSAASCKAGAMSRSFLAGPGVTKAPSLLALVTLQSRRVGPHVDLVCLEPQIVLAAPALPCAGRGPGGHPGLGLRGWGKLDRDSGAPLCLAPTSSALALRGDQCREKLAHVASAHCGGQGRGCRQQDSSECPKTRLLSSSAQGEDRGFAIAKT